MSTAPGPIRPIGERRRRERGAVIVEMALCVPVLIILVLGIIDYGTMFTDKISLKSGTREATWNSSRQIWGSAVPCGLVGVSASGNPSGDANTQKVMCMAKTRTQLNTSAIRTKVVFINIDTPTTPGTYAAGQGVMVCTMRQGYSVTGFFSFTLDNTVQKAKLAGVIVNDAPNPDGSVAMTALQETPLAGQSWSFCDPNTTPST